MNHFQFSLSCIHDIDYFVSLKLDISNEIETARYTTKHKLQQIRYKIFEDLIIITSTFRSLDICRSEPFLRLIPLNLSDHQKGIYALRCLFASWYILLQQQASEVVYFVEQLLQICFFTRFHSMTRKQRLCFFIFNPLTARQTSHDQQQRNMMSLVSERRKKKNPRTL